MHVGGSVVHTGQLFFPDALTREVYEAAAYASRGNPSTTAAQDSIYANGGERGLLALKKVGAGYLGTITMGMHK